MGVMQRIVEKLKVKVTYGLTEDGMELHKELMHFEPLAEQWYGAADRPRRY